MIIYYYAWRGGQFYTEFNEIYNCARKLHQKMMLIIDNKAVSLTDQEAAKCYARKYGVRAHIIFHKNESVKRLIRKGHILQGREVVRDRKKVKKLEQFLCDKSNFHGYIGHMNTEYSQTPKDAVAVYVGRCFCCNKAFYDYYKACIIKPEAIVLRRPEWRSGEYGGLYSFFVYSGGKIEWANKNGINTWIDMKYCRTPNTEELYKENVWDYYYEQEHTEQEIVNSRYILSDAVEGKGFEYKFEEIENQDYLRKKSEIFKSINKLNSQVRQIVEIEFARIRQVVKDEKVLGIKFRTTDYSPQMIPRDHWYQTSAHEMCVLAEKYMKEWGCGYIYAAVESQESLNELKEYFGDKLLFYQCELIDHYTCGAAALVHASAAGPRRAGEDYVVTIELLMRCNSVLLSCNSGSLMAVILNGGKYDNIKFIDKGVKKVETDK